jgi:16S rRNA (uracil1498-N3)-methyltransferase
VSRFYVKPTSIRGNTIHVSGDEAHHAIDVMRLKKGDHIVTFDGEGKEYEGTITNVTKAGVIAEILTTKTTDNERSLTITLAQAIPKKAKIDFIVEKATELGLTAIIPLHTARTIVTLSGEKKASKQKRWEKIARVASKQCGRLTVPTIHPVSAFDDVITTSNDYDLALMACLDATTQDIKRVLDGFGGTKIIVFIGPEGDFTKEEIETAREAGCTLISLGPRVLRVDTAALNVLSILRYALG